MDSGADTTGEVFDERPQKRRTAPPPPAESLWAGVQPEILGVVLRFLPCSADRAAVRSVSRHWRAAARGRGLPPPLPLLVRQNLKFSCLRSDGTMTSARRVPIPKEMQDSVTRCVGSFDSWLVGVTPSKDHADGDCDCFLVNTFSHEVVHLPHPITSRDNFTGHSNERLAVINGKDYIHFRSNDLCRAFFNQVVLSASPDSGSKFIVAASFDYYITATSIALWQPGMISWLFCAGVDIHGPKELAFYNGKLYVLQRFRPHLFAFELGEDDRGVIVTRVELCVTEPLCPHPFGHDGSRSVNMVVWRGRLLLIIRYYDDHSPRHDVFNLKVFALDFDTNPYGVSEIHSFDGDCIFVSLGGCKSFPAGRHGGVEGDLIYFVPDYWNPNDRFVYSMRDAVVRPFAMESSPGNIRELNDLPVWLFPSD
ncbi:hypothetical protein ACP70R_007445 [Stipagrostis hirtigluma subsp. patula]